MHRNKTFATALGLLFGGIGLHRFYLRGPLDRLGLLHMTAVPISGLVIGLAPHAAPFFKVLPLLVSYIVGHIEALVIGLEADDKFDAAYNAASGKQSDSSWPLAVVLILTLATAAILAIGAMSRLFDLLYTGGAYG